MESYITGLIGIGILLYMSFILWAVSQVGTPGKRNIWIGLRTPKSLKSDENWEKAHQLNKAYFPQMLKYVWLATILFYIILPKWTIIGGLVIFVIGAIGLYFKIEKELNV